MMIGTTMQAAFEQGRQILSSDLPEVVTDIAGIKKDKTPTTKKLTFVATKNELLADSHCDIAWSDGLAIYAGENLQTCGPCRMEASRSVMPEQAIRNSFNEPNRMRRKQYEISKTNSWPV